MASQEFQDEIYHCMFSLCIIAGGYLENIDHRHSRCFSALTNTAPEKSFPKDKFKRNAHDLLRAICLEDPRAKEFFTRVLEILWDEGVLGEIQLDNGREISENVRGIRERIDAELRTLDYQFEEIKRRLGEDAFDQVKLCFRLAGGNVQGLQRCMDAIDSRLVRIENLLSG